MFYALLVIDLKFSLEASLPMLVEQQCSFYTVQIASRTKSAQLFEVDRNTNIIFQVFYGLGKLLFNQ